MMKARVAMKGAGLSTRSGDVSVEVDPSYEDLGALLVHEVTREAWADLASLLYGRSGWYCRLLEEAQGQLTLAWTFGPIGEALFVIDVRLMDAGGSELKPDEEYDPAEVTVAMHVYDHELGEDLFFDIAASVESWLDANEPRYKDRPRALRHLAEVNDWNVLKSVGFDVDVDYDIGTGSFVATVRKLALTPAFDRTLGAVLTNASEAIADAFGADKGVAAGIEIRAHLTIAASANV